MPGQAMAPEVMFDRKHSGYGMPCAKCKTYYAADLRSCPVCNTCERMSPALEAIPATVHASAPAVDPAVLEEERERFLREFNAQNLAPQVEASAARGCVNRENHPNGLEPASVCGSCHQHVRERMDVLEAALHMDVKEAAQIVYEAVWADPTDSTKTYENAAQALLSELRKRSGVTPLYELLQPSSH
jgi:hypothetical protein